MLRFPTKAANRRGDSPNGWDMKKSRQFILRPSGERSKPRKFWPRLTNWKSKSAMDFGEINHGHWEQMTRREVEQKFPEEAAEWEKDPYTFAPKAAKVDWP